MRSSSSLTTSAAQTHDSGTIVANDLFVRRRAATKTSKPAMIWRVLSSRPVASPIQMIKCSYGSVICMARATQEIG
jgi:hypothetical protein